LQKEGVLTRPPFSHPIDFVFFNFWHYDGRTSKHGAFIKTDSFGIQTFFYYDGWRTVEEQSSTGATQATYVFGNYLDEVLTMDRGGQSYYYHQNALWSAYALSDSTGTGVEGYAYDSYGYQTIHLPGPDGTLWTSDDVILPGAKSAFGNPFLFTEQRSDSEIGLLFYKYRHLSTILGRFVQRDPVGYSNRMNLYEYADSSPTTTLDPLGRNVTKQYSRPSEQSLLLKLLSWISS
jgi:RHS repeat-associated protein